MVKKVIKLWKMGDIYRLVVFEGTGTAAQKRTPDWIISDKKSEPSTDVERLSQSLSRAKRTVREYALCNPWDYFVTLTLRQDRYDLKKFKKDFGVWVGNFNKKYGCKLRYIVIPEQHKDGATHAHGMLSGVHAAAIAANDYGYLTMKYYEDRFGFISMSPIRDSERTASYITKYITKQPHGDLSKGEHLFFASRGLRKAELVEALAVEDCFLPVPDFQNDYVSLNEFYEIPDMLKRGIRLNKAICGQPDWVKYK